MLLRETNLKDRDFYLDKLIAFKDRDIVKIVTGVRRCGKSSLLKLMVHYLESQDIEESQILQMNFESAKYRDMSRRDVYDYVLERVPKDKKAYLFFDEIQRIYGWHDAINSLRVDIDCDIYITGSNAYLLSGDYATFLAGRYVEIKMLPLTFREFVEFSGFDIEKVEVGNKVHFNVYDNNHNFVKEKDLYELFFKYGGIPAVSIDGIKEDVTTEILDSIYSTIVVRDILDREKFKDAKEVNNESLLRRIVLFLADNIGNNTSINSMSNTLKSEKLIGDEKKEIKPSVNTVQNYVSALIDAYMFYEIKRYDIKGKDYLKTLGKYYIVDIGLRNYLIGERDRDTGHVLENIVFLELKKRGYKLATGKIGENEIDFIATNVDEKKYIQVSYALEPDDVLKRELMPLKRIDDNYEKIIITGTEYKKESIDGIKIIYITDFLLNT